MEFFYRVLKFKRSYTLEINIETYPSVFTTFKVNLDNFRSTHNLHTTGLDCYGLVAVRTRSGFYSVEDLSDWRPFFFTKSRDYFYIHFPTNFGYISKRGSFLKTGSYHLFATFRFNDFCSFLANLGFNII